MASRTRTTTNARTGRPSDPSRRAQILQVAGRVFAERGYDSASMRDLADAAGLVPSGIYHHFGSKEDLLKELLQDFYSESLAEAHEIVAQDKPADELLRELCELMFRYVLERPSETAIVFDDYRILSKISSFAFMAEEARTIEKLWVRVIERAVTEERFSSEVQPVVAYRSIAGAIFTAGRWFDPKGKIPPADFISQQATIFLDGLRVR